MTRSADAPPPDAEPCPGCGLSYPPADGPVHAYIGASAGCWARYGELLALEYGNVALMRWHRMAVDAYAAQHPGVPERRSAQSVRVHLTGLCLVLEHGMEPSRVAPLLQKLADGRVYGWLEPPPLLTPVGVPDAIAAAGTARYPETVRAWAEAVWRAWTPHHATIRAEADRLLTSH